MRSTQAGQRSHSDCLQVYLREIQEGALLTAAEERVLAEAIAAGDTDARARMIQANLRLVVKIARDYVGRGMGLDDLIGEGNLGLIRAAQEFEPRFGTRFSTYASYWIKQAIRHALITTTPTIRLPAHMVGLLTRWRRAERSLCRELGRVPAFDEVAGALELSETQRSLVAKAHHARQLKLENCVTHNDECWSPLSMRDGHEAPGNNLEADDERRLLLNRLNRLEDRERMILALRYGLEGELPLTLKEIGRRLGITREWVRKIELRAVRKLDSDYTGDSAVRRRWGRRRTGRWSTAAGAPAHPPAPESPPCDATSAPQRRRLKPRPGHLARSQRDERARCERAQLV
jgi:RNA polymerase primary sigma factor